MSTAAAANEQTYNVGQDIYTSCELADWQAEEDAEAERVAERWEREGRREMLFMLDLGGY